MILQRYRMDVLGIKRSHAMEFRCELAFEIGLRMLYFFRIEHTQTFYKLNQILTN
jgi:hypothetical protein